MYDTEDDIIDSEDDIPDRSMLSLSGRYATAVSHQALQHVSEHGQRSGGDVHDEGTPPHPPHVSLAPS